MSDYKDNDTKRGLPNNFVLFLIAAVLIVLMMQNFLETKFANVSFSYQLEHLVNLGLIQPEDSRKTAINDNLVTFSGQFKERLSEESKQKYKFLQLLNTRNLLTTQKNYLQEEMKKQKGKILEAADFYLHLTGMKIPVGGYVIVEDVFVSNEDDQRVVVNSLSRKNITSLKDIDKELNLSIQNPNEENVNSLGKKLYDVIRNFRSPLLGIGNETIKNELRELQMSVSSVMNSENTDNQKIVTYKKALNQLQLISKELNTEDDHMRLNKLRSVRNFRQTLEAYNQVTNQLEENRVKLDKARQNVANVIWYFNNKELTTRALEKQDPEIFSQWFVNAREEWEAFPKNKGGYFKAPDQPLNTVLEKNFRSEEPPPKYLSYMFPAMIAFAVVIVLYMLFARQVKGVGANAMNFGKSPARLIMPKGDDKITFKDVAGVDEAKEELEEIVEFLKDPKKFTALGGKIPRGVLCIGPPGTGKTLIARAVAGEAGRPFFSISGSDFVEMFVGVGASRIRDLFEQAKKHAPCIIFMDEIDAVGRHRGAGIGGGHDEREQTLNQLLVEMDGFNTTEGVILMAATNRPDVLDKALLRPGRFDRRIIINLPDIKGRYEILKVHARKIKMDTEVNLMNLARSTPGCSGADLANILNESALLAARKGRTAVTMTEIMEARDKVLYGKERRSLDIDEGEKETTAYHESGHAVVGLFVEHGDPIDKVTIIPRGMALGVTMFLPEKNKVSYWKNEIVDRLAVLMGGRCAEEIFINDISSGARQDIEQATQLARAMVCEWGMSEKLGTVAYDERSESGQYLGMSGYHEKKYSEETAREIDAEVRRILDEALQRARKIIMDNRDVVELMTRMLMEFETLDNVDIQMIKERKFTSEEKKARLKAENEKHRKFPPPPPMKPISEEKTLTDENIQPSQA
ncbi:MAG: ATP-dependent zinc metalloprotease FtsH [Chlamydiales bacterium]